MCFIFQQNRIIRYLNEYCKVIKVEEDYKEYILGTIR